jgi:hypothetical protein
MTLVLFFALLLLGGCLNFLSQEIFISRSNDRQDMFFLLVYHGLYSDGDDQKSISQFESVLNDGGEFAISDNWPFDFKLGDIKKWLSEGDLKGRPQAERFLNYLCANLEVKNGGLYSESATGQLSGFQIIRIRGVDEFTRLANEAICESLTIDKPSTDTFPLTGALWYEKSKKGGWEWHTFKRSTLLVNIPAAPPEMESIRKKYIGEAVTGIHDESSTYSLKAVKDLLSENVLSLIQKRDGFQFIAGIPEEKVNQLSFNIKPEKVKEYSGNLLNFATRTSLWKGDMRTRDIVQDFKKSPERFFNTLPENKPAGLPK